MLKSLAFASFCFATALSSGAALAEQGTSSSYGTVGWGPVIPTQSLTNRDRAWNHDNQAKYQAEDGSEWLRRHGKNLFPF
jgi:hypothetical protein